MFLNIIIKLWNKMKEIFLFLEFICLTVAIIKNPEKCDLGCTNEDKLCPGHKKDCIYWNSTEYSCDSSSDCPLDYECGNITNELEYCVASAN